MVEALQRRDALIRFSNVSKKYGDAIILDNVSFEVKEGERLSLIGPGGCGKTPMIPAAAKYLFRA